MSITHGLWEDRWMANVKKTHEKTSNIINPHENAN